MLEELLRDEGLGDVYCTEAEYIAAATAIGGMNNAFTASPAAEQDRFRPQVNAILQSWNTVTAAMQSSALPNVTFFCQFKALGQQALGVTQQIAAATGQAAPTIPPALQPGAASEAIRTAGWIAGLAVGAYVLVHLR